MAVPDLCNFCSQVATWYVLPDRSMNDPGPERKVFFCRTHEGGWMLKLRWWPANELPQETLGGTAV